MMFREAGEKTSNSGIMSSFGGGFGLGAFNLLFPAVPCLVAVRDGRVCVGLVFCC